MNETKIAMFEKIGGRNAFPVNCSSFDYFDTYILVVTFLTECNICLFCCIPILYVGSLEISDIAEQCTTTATPKPRPTTHNTGVL